MLRPQVRPAVEEEVRLEVDQDMRAMIASIKVRLQWMSLAWLGLLGRGALRGPLEHLLSSSA